MKKLLKKHWPLIGIGLLLIVVAFYLVPAKKLLMRESIIGDLIPEAGVRLKDIHYVHDNPDDGVKWLLDAKAMTLSKDRQIISFNDFKLKLEPVNKPSIELEGQRGKWNKGSGEINLYGDLRGYTRNGYRIRTDHIRYSGAGNIESETPVKIIGPFFTVEGQGFRLNIKKETFRLDSDVTTTFDSEALNL